jgi:hypothetical protein
MLPSSPNAILTIIKYLAFASGISGMFLDSFKCLGWMWVLILVITKSNRKFAHYGRNLWNILGLTTCECSSGYILALHIKVGIEKHVYSLCSSIVLDTPDFGYMFRKLGHMVQSVGIHRGLCSGDYSIAYIEHNPWHETQGRWLNTHKQGIFSDKSCLHGWCTNYCGVKLSKLNLEQLSLVRKVTVAFLRRLFIHPWYSAWQVTTWIACSTINPEILQTMLWYGVGQTSVAQTAV